MSITSDFSKFKKIDAHSHIGTFGSPFNIHFNADLLLKQMEEFNIEKTILCSDGPHTNEETVAAFKAHPDKIIPLMWINCAEGKPAYDALEHYIRDEHFAGAKLQSLFDGYCADDPCVDPVAEICEKYGKPLFIHSGHPPFSLPWQIGLLAERHPHLPIVMIHMGHAHGVYVDAAITMAKKYDNIWLETSGTSRSPTPTTLSAMRRSCSASTPRSMPRPLRSRRSWHAVWMMKDWRTFSIITQLNLWD